MAYHKLAAEVFDKAIEDIHQIQKDAREDNRYQNGEIPAWPIVIARLPKGWGGPRYNDWSGPKFDGRGSA